MLEWAMSDACELELLGNVKGQRQVADRFLQLTKEETRRLKAINPDVAEGILMQEAAETVKVRMKKEAVETKVQMIHQHTAKERLATGISMIVREGRSPETAYREVIAAAGDSAKHAENVAISKFNHDLEKEKLYTQFTSGDKTFFRDVAFELEQVNTTNGNVGVTKNKAASRLAQMYQKHVNYYRSQLKAMGLRTENLEGRILRRLWERDRLLEAAPRAKDFIRLMQGRVRKIGDQLTSEMTPEQIDRALTDAYNELLGIGQGEPKLDLRDLRLERKTYAVRQAESRQIHFNNVDDELYVMETFGGGDMAALMADTIADLGQQVHLTQQLGSNYRFSAYALLDQVEQLGGDRQAAQNGGGPRIPSIENILNKVTGFYDENVGNPTVAKWSDGITNYARAVLLPAASLNSVTDLATLDAAGRRHVLDNAGNFASTVKRFITGVDLPPDILRSAAGIIETDSVHHISQLNRRVSLPGLTNRFYNGSLWVADKTFQLNGLNRMTRTMKQTAYNQYSRMMANAIEAGRPWDDLPSPSRQLLVEAGLLKDDWAKLISRKDAVFAQDHFKFVNTEVLDPVLASRVNAALGRYVSNEAVLSPNIITQLYLDGGLQRGTLPHAMYKQATFLFSYPAAFIRQAFMKQGQATGYASFGMLRYVAALTFYGVIVEVLRDVAYGRSRDYTNPEIMTQILYSGFIRGGAGTLYLENLLAATGAETKLMDLIHGADRDYKTPNFQGNVVEALLYGGGTEWAYNLVSGTGKTAWELMTGDVDAAVENAIRTARRTLPTFTLGVKPLLDAAVYDNVAEMMDLNIMRQFDSRYNARTGGENVLFDIF
jgi:hypothetical protein